MKILGIAGSLRSESYNRKLLKVALEIAAKNGDEVNSFDIISIPLFNADAEKVQVPESVLMFKEAIETADFIIFTSPEYNHSISGVLKNAIDWASRPPQNSFKGKVGVVMGASSGRYGTSRMQPHLKTVLEYLGVLIVPSPIVYVGPASEHFNESGQLSDEKTYAKVEELVLNGLKVAKALEQST